MPITCRMKKFLSGPGLCFAQLPAEIRNKIYGFALHMQQFNPYLRRSGGSLVDWISADDLLRVDHQFLAEADEVLWSTNTVVLSFKAFHDLRNNNAGIQRLEWIRSLIIFVAESDTLDYEFSGMGILPPFEVSV